MMSVENESCCFGTREEETARDDTTPLQKRMHDRGVGPTQPPPPPYTPPLDVFGLRKPSSHSPHTVTEEEGEWEGVTRMQRNAQEREFVKSDKG
jgi:hypothetical protein